ncbi:hydroxymethylcytosylglucuronate/cytosylglucuronate synthase [Frankia sp. B2]|uniref:hydroxymethylcytosylglucuronate/cytosylglucurona te synthase n=1 Tax=Frankia sp. B2 TaxID=2541730 RepID=UPI00106D99B9|nr:hydroxymethylcytosylglucuronate/cytosylglucuronate synthase [Frankia sp. B2]TFE31014.1 hydroxymethylcytosylglucuronate/cytosylglucuronate synthase [Frankia sp. B2]
MTSQTAAFGGDSGLIGAAESGGRGEGGDRGRDGCAGRWAAARRESDPRRADALVFCGIDFGWGSAGKLHSILRALCPGPGSPPRLVGLGTLLGRDLLAELPVEAWYDECPRDIAELRMLLDRHGVAAGLVVLEPAVAAALEDAGCPTVYVDSLPHLWTKRDPLPTGATRYCAQLCGTLPRPSWEPLRRIDRLSWVEPIVGPPRGGRRAVLPGLAVLNVGGLQSAVAAAAWPAYLQLVLGPAVQALVDSGFTRIEICGNVGTEDVVRPTVGDGTAVVRTGARSHERFLSLLDQAALLLTSPGLTTLVEAADCGVPTVCLPPQNVSQFLNADQFAAHAVEQRRVPWPEEVLDRTAVEAARLEGEDAALRLVYGTIRRASRADSADAVRRVLALDLYRAIDHARGSDGSSELTRLLGNGGAHQVASMVQELLAAGSTAGRGVVA